MGASVKTWYGKEIVVGSIVGRSMEGRSGSFKIGIVRKLLPDKNKVTVEWHFYPGYVHFKEPGPNGRDIWHMVDMVMRNNPPSKGNPSIESLFLLQQEDFDGASRLHYATKQALDLGINNAQVFKRFIENYK